MQTAPRTLIPVAALTLAVAVSTACDLAFVDFSAQQSDKWSNTWELEPGGRFELRNVNGRIEIGPSDGRTLEVVAERTARAASDEMAKEALQRVRIEVDASPSSVRINTVTDRSGGFFNRAGSIDVRYTVRVPADAELEISTTNGGIELRAMRGATRLRTTNGGIRARDVRGPLTARTTNGGLDIDLAAVSDKGVDLGWTNGGLDLRLPRDARASIEASVTNGGIDTGSFRLDALESSRRRLDARLNGGGARITIRGTNGGIRLSER